VLESGKISSGKCLLSQNNSISPLKTSSSSTRSHFIEVNSEEINKELEKKFQCSREKRKKVESSLDDCKRMTIQQEIELSKATSKSKELGKRVRYLEQREQQLMEHLELLKQYIDQVEGKEAHSRIE